jgi:hypothetical protein
MLVSVSRRGGGIAGVLMAHSFLNQLPYIVTSGALLKRPDICRNISDNVYLWLIGSQ